MNHDLRKQAYFLAGAAVIAVVALFEPIIIDEEPVALIRVLLFYEPSVLTRFSALQIFRTAVSDWTFLLLPVVGTLAGVVFVSDELVSGYVEYLTPRMGRKQYMDRCFWASLAVGGAVMTAGLLIVALFCLAVFPLQADRIAIGEETQGCLGYWRAAARLTGGFLLSGLAGVAVSMPVVLLSADKCVIFSFVFLYHYVMQQITGGSIPAAVSIAAVLIAYLLTHMIWKRRSRP